jgi:hypothetical protein
MRCQSRGAAGVDFQNGSPKIFKGCDLIAKSNNLDLGEADLLRIL